MLHLLRISHYYINQFCTLLNVMGTLLIVLIMLLVNGDVLLRNLFNAPISGVPEIVSMSIVAIVFLQVAQSFQMERLTRTEMILKKMALYSKRLRAGIELLYNMAALFLIIVLIKYSWGLFIKAWVKGTFKGTIGDFTAPIWPIKLIIIVGCVALCLQFIAKGILACYAMINNESLPPHNNRQ